MRGHKIRWGRCLNCGARFFGLAKKCDGRLVFRTLDYRQMVDNNPFPEAHARRQFPNLYRLKDFHPQVFERWRNEMGTNSFQFHGEARAKDFFNAKSEYDRIMKPVHYKNFDLGMGVSEVMEKAEDTILRGTRFSTIIIDDPLA
jgi:hypothetical protein